jgi:FAD/FMN-containing dehydrogenase
LAPLCGSAPGVVGYLSGGGIGPLVRSFGLSADHVRAFEMVTGAGQVLRVTPDEHADLFWGLRGGKSMLGIVTAVEIDLLPIAEFYGGAIYFDGAQVADVLRGWQRWSSDLPESVNTSVCIQQLPLLPGIPEPLAGRMTVAVRYTAVGDFAEAQRLLEPMRAVADRRRRGDAVRRDRCGTRRPSGSDADPRGSRAAARADARGGRRDSRRVWSRIEVTADDRRAETPRRRAGP